MLHIPSHNGLWPRRGRQLVQSDSEVGRRYGRVLSTKAGGWCFRRLCLTLLPVSDRSCVEWLQLTQPGCCPGHLAMPLAVGRVARLPLATHGLFGRYLSHGRKRLPRCPTPHRPLQELGQIEYNRGIGRPRPRSAVAIGVGETPSEDDEVERFLDRQHQEMKPNATSESGHCRNAGGVDSELDKAVACFQAAFWRFVEPDQGCGCCGALARHEAQSAATRSARVVSSGRRHTAQPPWFVPRMQPDGQG